MKKAGAEEDTWEGMNKLAMESLPHAREHNLGVFSSFCGLVLP